MNTLRRWLRNWPRMLVTMLPMVLALLHTSGHVRIGLLDRLDAIVYDTRLRTFMPGTLDERIVILDIDEQSLAEIGRWPWSRHHMAELVDRLFDEQGAAVLGMDVVFAEPDESSGLGQLRSLADNELRHQPGFAERMPELERRLDYDQRFADALRERPVVLGYYFTSDREGRKSGVLPAPVFDDASLEGRSFRVTEWDGYGSNIPRLAEAAPLAGFFNPVVDVDGVVRSLPLLVRHEGRYYESLALAIFRLLAGMPDVRPGYPAGSDAGSTYTNLESVLLVQGERAMAIPVDDQVGLLVPFRGPGGVQGGSFRYVSASDVLKGRLPPGSLQDTVVLLGTTAPGLLDLRVTPVGETYPGVETHANILSGLLDGNLLVRPDYATGYDIVMIVLAGLLLALGLPWLSALWSVVASALLGGALVGLNFWLYLNLGLVLPLAASVLMVALAFALHMSYGYFVESRSKRELANLFGTYVPPELVDEMVKDPDRYSMQAQDRELTVMFSDMRGFTALSETMLPQRLQQLLNHVFSRLTHIIRLRRGTIDKYMGDCVMAFWGAPVDTPNHARLAVQAALEMTAAVQEVNVEHRTQGLPPIGMGVGLNTGTMCVGDMGSDLRRSYTVIGDAVNLGSRLEGLSKHYGVDIVVSDSTRVEAGEDFIWQELDKVKVKGKDEAVTIHTVLGTADQLTDDLRDELGRWNTFLQAYRAQDWDSAETLILALIRSVPHKVLYHLYQERIARFKGQPVDPLWDASTQFDTK
jgi:adenylate cyclase